MTLQLHSFELTHQFKGPVVAHAAPLIAVHIPPRLASAWLVQIQTWQRPLLTEFAVALASVRTPLLPGAYHVREVSGHSAFYAGRDALGTATLLIRTTDLGRTVPLKLAGIEARFSVPCHIAEPGGTARTASLTAVMCLSHEPEVEGYFCRVIDLLVGVLGPAPTSAAVASAINDLVDLFQKLGRPPRKPIVGLVGELLVIEAARDPAKAISAWRTDANERYDFASEISGSKPRRPRRGSGSTIFRRSRLNHRRDRSAYWRPFALSSLVGGHPWRG